MRVLLKQDWFGPNAHLYQKAPHGQPTDIPEQFRDVLPRFAVVVGEDGQPEPAPVVAPPPRLRDFDDERAAAEAEEALKAKAEAFRQTATRKRIDK